MCNLYRTKKVNRKIGILSRCFPIICSLFSHWWNIWHKTVDAIPFRYLASELINLQLDRRCSTFVYDEVLAVTDPNLRDLTVECPLTPTELAGVRSSNFPCLENLRLPTTDEFQFETLCEFESLRSCVVKSLQIDRESCTTSVSLTSLFVVLCTSTNFSHLLRHLPRLVYFKTNNMHTMSVFDPSELSTSFVHQNLLTLKILYFDLDNVPNLESVDLSTIVKPVLVHLSAVMDSECVLGFYGLTYEHCAQLQSLANVFPFRYLLCRLFYDQTDKNLPTVVNIRHLPLFCKHRLYIPGILADTMLSPRRTLNSHVSGE